MKRLGHFIVALLALAVVEVVRVGAFGRGPSFASGFEFTMTAFVLTWLADEAKP